MGQGYQERETRGSMELTIQLVYSNDEIQLQEETLSLKLRWTVIEEDTQGHHPVSMPVHWIQQRQTTRESRKVMQNKKWKQK